MSVSSPLSCPKHVLPASEGSFLDPSPNETHFNKLAWMIPLENSKYLFSRYNYTLDPFCPRTLFRSAKPHCCLPPLNSWSWLSVFLIWKLITNSLIFIFTFITTHLFPCFAFKLRYLFNLPNLYIYSKVVEDRTFVLGINPKFY